MTQPVPVPTPPAPLPAPPPTPAPADPPSAPPTPVPAPPPDDRPLGPAGEKALAAERDARKALEKKLAPLEQFLAALQPAGTPQGGASEVELLQQRFAEHEKTLADERAARWRAEVAHEKGLTPQQAARLQGASRDEFAADADALVALFPTAPAGPRNPAPDPSQGARGGQPGPDLDAQIGEAKKAGDFWRAAALERSKLLNITRPT